MPAVGQFLDLLEAISRRDWSEVAEVVRRVADAERKAKHYTAAHDLLQALEVATSNAGYDQVGTVANALVAIPPKVDSLYEEDVSGVPKPVLPQQLANDVAEFVHEWQMESRLREAGLRPRHSLLLHGKPGCGKTHLARYIAGAVGMRLYSVSFDALVSSFLGETANNIRQIFSFASANRCALFIDEVDAIGKLRDDANELGELKRVVISLLQNIDRASSRSLLLAATNHPHALDVALWRRFDVVWELPLPTDTGRAALFKEYFGPRLPPAILDFLAECSNGMSGADIQQICGNAQRRALLQGENGDETGLVLSLVEHIRRTGSGREDADQRNELLVQAALRLRDARSGQYSFNDLERLTGIPHSTLHHRSRSRTS
jgi:DNA replication protein DnaC